MTSDQHRNNRFIRSKPSFKPLAAAAFGLWYLLACAPAHGAVFLPQQLNFNLSGFLVSTSSTVDDCESVFASVCTFSYVVSTQHVDPQKVPFKWSGPGLSFAGTLYPTWSPFPCFIGGCGDTVSYQYQTVFTHPFVQIENTEFSLTIGLPRSHTPAPYWRPKDGAKIIEPDAISSASSSATIINASPTSVAVDPTSPDATTIAELKASLSRDKTIVELSSHAEQLAAGEYRYSYSALNASMLSFDLDWIDAGLVGSLLAGASADTSFLSLLGPIAKTTTATVIIEGDPFTMTLDFLVPDTLGLAQVPEPGAPGLVAMGLLFILGGRRARYRAQRSRA